MFDEREMGLVKALVAAYKAAGKKIVLPTGLRPQLERLFGGVVVNVDLLDEFGNTLIALCQDDWWDEVMWASRGFVLPACRFLTGGVSALTDREFALLLFDLVEQRKGHELLADAAAVGELSPVWSSLVSELGPHVKWATDFEMLK